MLQDMSEVMSSVASSDASSDASSAIGEENLCELSIIIFFTEEITVTYLGGFGGGVFFYPFFALE